MAKPVVASPQAFAGIVVRAGEHLLAARTESEWIDNIEYLWNNALSEPDSAQPAASSCSSHHSWTTCLEPFADLLNLAATPELVAGGVQS